MIRYKAGDGGEVSGSPVGRALAVRREGKGWVVDHVPTGRRVNRTPFAARDAAVKMAAWIGGLGGWGLADTDPGSAIPPGPLRDAIGRHEEDLHKAESQAAAAKKKGG